MSLTWERKYPPKSRKCRVLGRLNPRKNMLRHIVIKLTKIKDRHILIKLTKIKDKEKLLKATREK